MQRRNGPTHTRNAQYVTISAVIVPSAALRFAVKVYLVPEKIINLVIESESGVGGDRSSANITEELVP